MIWFMLFVAFVFVIPFKWWQATAQAKDEKVFYEKQIRDLKWNDDIRRDVQQSLQNKITELEKLVTTLDTHGTRFMQWYDECEEKINRISEYVYDSNLDATPQGEYILSIINGEDENEDEDDE